MSAEPAMLKKLRRKFIAIIMGIATLLLVVMLSAICVVEYRQQEQMVIGELKGSLADAGNPFGWLGGRGDGSETYLIEPEDDELGEERPSTPRIGGQGEERSSFPIALYFATRDGSTAISSPQSSAELDDADLAVALAEVFKGAPESTLLPDGVSVGRIDLLDLFYACEEAPFGYTIAFADASSVQWQGLAGTLLLVGLAALIVLLGLSILFSRWALRPVRQAWEQQQRFIADASHELKTPLTVILANNSILEAHRADTVESQHQWVESTTHEARRMQGLVESLLQLTRIEQRTEAPQERSSFSEAAEREVLAFEPVAFERGLELQSSIQDGIEVRAAAEDLERLCAILLDNACKHATPSTTVRLTLSREGSSAKLAVANQGTPIPAEDLPHIFERFYQADKARTKDAGNGYGLGLAIAQETAQMLSGSITAKSSTEKGTVFSVSLPL